MSSSNLIRAGGPGPASAPGREPGRTRDLVIGLLGPPGSGKRHIAEALAARFDLVHVSAGDFLRRLAAGDSQFGQRIRPYQRAGRPPPDGLVTDTFLDLLRCRGGPLDRVLFDGFPRTLGQAEALELTADAGCELRLLLYVHVGAEAALARLLHRWACPACWHTQTIAAEAGGEARRCPRCDVPLVRRRGDGDPDRLRERRQIFFRDSGPVVEHYRRRGLVTEVDGELPPREAAAHAVAGVSRVIA